MKRIFYVLLALILALSFVLTGCGSKQTTSQKANEQEQKLEEATIRYWDSVNDADPNDYMTKWINENIDIFQKQHPNIKIEFTNTANGDQYLNKISTEMAANNVPDIFMTWVAGRLEPFVKAGRLYALNSVIENSPILSETVNPGNLNSTTFDGKVYAIPAELAGEVVFYNKALFKKYNLEVPKTWDELLNVIKVFKENGVTPFSLANKDPWTGTIPYMAIFDRINGPEEYKKTCFERQTVFNSEAYVKAAEYLVELVKAGAYANNFNSLDGLEGMEMFKSGKAAMRFNGTWELPEHIKALGDDLGWFNWVDMPESKGKSSEDFLLVQNRAYAIGEASKNKEATAKFMEFMFSKERQKILAESGYMIACRNINFDESKLHPVSAEIAKSLSSAKYPILIWDVMLGQNIGKELNLATQAILGGADIKQTLEKLNKIAQTEWD